MNCLLDMDGLLSNFNIGAAKLFDRASDTTNIWSFHNKNWGLSDDDFCNIISENSPRFWEFLPTYRWTFNLIDLMNEQFKTHWTICTCPMGEHCKEGKQAWLNRLNIRIPLPVKFTCTKERYATPNTILIDDHEPAVNKFIAAGGVGILFPAPWNRYGDYDPDPVTFIGNALNEYH